MLKFAVLSILLANTQLAVFGEDALVFAQVVCKFDSSFIGKKIFD